MSGSDESRLEKARGGDIKAFSELFEEWRPVTFRVACRLVGEQDAEDVVMEAYLKAWQALPGFGGRSSLKTWLYRIVHNVAVDRLRSRRQEQSLDERAETAPSLSAEAADDRETRPDALAGAADAAVRVNAALSRLSADHRSVLLLRYADGLRYGEIASAAGVSIGTVMSRLFHAKRRLRRLLGEGVV